MAKRKRLKNKKKYRVKNWKEYNEALKRRGSVDLWISESVLNSWYAQKHTGKKGHPQLYANSTIQCALTLQAVFRLPLRATQGFLKSILELLNLSKLPTPDYSTLSRRRNAIQVILPYTKPGGTINIVLDSTGLKVYGEGEWKVRQHGYTKRRTWRKLHLALDPKTHMIESSVLTTNSCSDSQVFSDLLRQVNKNVKIASVSGDGAYDTKTCYEMLEKRGAKAKIPPRRNARCSRQNEIEGGFSPGNARNENLRTIQNIGRKQWKQQSGYHSRSLAETAMFRFKKIFGGSLSSRTLPNQVVEAHIKCYALNRMSAIGMPVSVAV